MISIIMPAYNRSSLIPRAVQSVIRQTYQDWELLVIDDAGTDDTKIVMAEYEKRDKRIHYIRNAENRGPAGTRNAGIRMAAGEFIAFLDSDDEWTETHLKECLSALSVTGYDVCSALWTEVRSGKSYPIWENQWFQDGFEQVSKVYGLSWGDTFWKFNNTFLEYILTDGFFCYHINTLVIHRKVIEQMGMFDESLRTNEDLDFLLRVLEKFPLVTVNKNHFIYHYGTDNLYAFADRSGMSREQFLSEPRFVKKHSYNMKIQIEVYQRIYQRIPDIACFRDRKRVHKNLKICLFKRYLTIAYMMHLSDRGKSFRYIIHALRYVENWKMLRTVLWYRKKDMADEYFCID